MTADRPDPASFSPQDDAAHRLEQLRVSVSPAIEFAAPAERLDLFLARLDQHLQTTLSFRPHEVPGSNVNVRLYRLGGRGRWLRANLADFLVSGGGGRFNISYHVVLERAQADRALLSVHGIDQTLRNRYDPHEVFGAVLTDVSSHVSDVAISPWFDSRNLPAHLASSPAGFARMVGPGRAFWWQ